MDRREFVKTAGTAAGAIAAERLLTPMLQAENTHESNGMIYRTLGRTGERVSAIGLGGYHIGRPSLQEQDAIQLIRQAVDRGITFLDNCWDYNDGASELRMGKALVDGYRNKVFLMTKIDGRTKAAAAQQIDESLKRLQTDHVDLMQFHEVIRLEDPDRIFAPGGALEAVLAARKAGKIRYIGFTGHKDPLVHLRMLEVAAQHQFEFDTVQMPLNLMDAHFRSFAARVLPLLLERGIGPLAMKSMGNGLLLKSKVVTPRQCLHYAMSLPVSTVITGMDSLPILEQALDAVRTFEPLDLATAAELLARTTSAAVGGQYEKFKTDVEFDSTAKYPQWLG
jgi:predicted aldo/keto reductase-like oxidoreductase